MKKLNILLSGLLLCGALFTSCDNEQALPPVSFPNGGSAETVGNGTWDTPYHVWQVLLGQDNGTDANGNTRGSSWTTGYIVGYIMDGAVFDASTSVFGAEGAGTANILLAETPEETDYEKCVPVQLSNIRNDINLSAHPDNLGKEITIKGSLEKYFGAYGIKSCSAYEWGDQGTYTPSEEPNPGTPGETGGTTYLTSGLGDFTVLNVNLPSELTAIWTWAGNNYGAKGTGYSSKNYAAEAYLISPDIKLSDKPSVTFQQAVNYIYSNNREDFLEVCVREGASGAWNVVAVTNWPEGGSWTFNTSEMDVAAYAGKTIQIGFHYKSTASCAPTWEVKTLTVK